jgi:hypothetical protein
MRLNKIVVLVVVIVSIAGLLMSGCATNAPQTRNTPAASTPTQSTTVSTPAPAPAPITVQAETKYNVLSPRGVQLPVNISPLANRLTTFDGKTIWLTQAEADAVIMPALFDRLKKDYPKTTFNKTESAARGPLKLTADQLKTCDAIVQGVAW